MKLPRKRYLLIVVTFLLAGTAVAGWLALPDVQGLRADNRVAEANDHIAAANDILDDIDMTVIGIDSFVSEDSIGRTAAELNASLPKLDESIARIEMAARAVDEASGLYRLPESYREYLDKKNEVAVARIKQMQALKEMVAELQPLYDNGDVIFAAIEEMDRLWGQVEFYIQTLQNDPAGASDGLQQAAATMRGLKDRIDSRNEESRFVLLEALSDSIENNALLAERGRELADAVASGDQAQVQQAASAMERQLLETTDTSAFFDVWVEYSIESDIDDFQELQEEQEDLDVEAAVLFNQRN